MTIYILLSFCFLVFNHINFGMWRESSLLTFQNEAQQNIIEDKKFEKNVYLHALAKDYEVTGKKEPDKYVARWYQTRRFKKEIANQSIQNASFYFNKHSLKGRQAIITYSNPELQTLLKVLQLSSEMQYPIIQYLFSGRKNELAVDKFYKNTLTNAYENLALAKEYAEKNKDLDFSEWFLLDTPEQYEMTLKLLSNYKFQQIPHIIPQELAVIKPLPTCIKTHPALHRLYSRDYEWREKVQYVINKSSDIYTRKKPLIFAGAIGIPLAVGGFAKKFDQSDTILPKMFVGSIASLGFIPGYVSSPLQDILGKKIMLNSNMLIALIGLFSSPLPFAIELMLWGYGVASTMTTCVEEKEPLPIIVKSLDQL